MSESKPRRASRLILIIGLAALFGGLWLILDAQGVGVPPFKRLWPALFLLAGAASLADFLFLGRVAGSAGWALTWTGFGVLGFALTLGYTDWRRILDWLPSFPMIIGLALIATWLADRSRTSHPVTGGVLVTLGLLGFAARFDFLERLLPSAQVVWAVVLLLGGGYFVWRAIARARS